MARPATGVTVTFATSGGTYELLDVQHPRFARESLDVSHHATTNAREFTPTTLYDSGELTLTIHGDPNQTPPYAGGAEEITITSPTITGEGTAANYKVQGFLTGESIGFPFEELITGELTWKCSGPVTITAATP